jgi:sterol desaturase/sphingolipid hydroxylase (fatty acid hydroxylase superfamily)
MILFIGLFTFWIVYLTASFVFPSDKSITRSNITKRKVAIQLIWNCIITIISGFFLCHIPQIFIFENVIYKYITALSMIEIWFYYSHRLMHHRWFYKWHSDHHTFIEPYGLAGLYCSCLEMLLVNQLSVVIPFQLLGFSLNETVIGSILIALNILKGHSVLHKRDDVPWYLPSLLIQSWDHDTHHQLMNCNYGILYLLDRIHGTYKR